MTAPQLLDLFCGAGGASEGYARAGFEVVGVDIEPQPHYPFEFHQADVSAHVRGDPAPELLALLAGFDAVHASPPCQGYSTQTAKRERHPRLIDPTRLLLRRSGLPYVIENVEAAGWAMLNPVRLCGSSFGLDLRRHRLFETNWRLVAPLCDHRWQTPRFRSLDMSMVKKGRLASVVGVHGHINYEGEFPLRCAAMGIDWMTNAELVEAIPPAYTQHIGTQLLEQLAVAA